MPSPRVSSMMAAMRRGVVKGCGSSGVDGLAASQASAPPVAIGVQHKQTLWTVGVLGASMCRCFGFGARLFSRAHVIRI